MNWVMIWQMSKISKVALIVKNHFLIFYLVTNRWHRVGDLQLSYLIGPSEHKIISSPIIIYHA